MAFFFFYVLPWPGRDPVHRKIQCCRGTHAGRGPSDRMTGVPMPARYQKTTTLVTLDGVPFRVIRKCRVELSCRRNGASSTAVSCTISKRAMAQAVDVTTNSLYARDRAASTTFNGSASWQLTKKRSAVSTEIRYNSGRTYDCIVLSSH